MKTKGSFILRALTALVLAVLMLFGTVSTAFAVVVDQADEGAAVDLADTSTNGSITGGTNVFLYIKTDARQDASWWTNDGYYTGLRLSPDNTFDSTTDVKTKTDVTISGTDYWRYTIPSETWGYVQFLRTNGTNVDTGNTAYNLIPLQTDKNCINKWWYNGTSAEWGTNINENASSLSISAPTNKVVANNSTTLSLTANPTNTSYNDNYTYSWTTSDNTNSTIGSNTAKTCTFKAKKSGKYTVTCTMSYKKKGYSGITYSNITATYDVYATIPDTVQLVLVPGSWTSDSAQLVVAFFDHAGSSTTWVNSTPVAHGANTYYVVDVPAGYDSYKWSRQKDSGAIGSSYSWDNQWTGIDNDLYYDSSDQKNMLTISDWTVGSLSKHVHTLRTKQATRDNPSLAWTPTGSFTIVATDKKCTDVYSEQTAASMSGYTISGWYKGTSTTSTIASNATLASSNSKVTPLNDDTDVYYYSLYTRSNVNVTVYQVGSTGTVAFTNMAGSTVNVTTASDTASLYYNKTGSITITPPEGYAFKITATGSLSTLNDQKFNSTHTFSSQKVTSASTLTVTYTCIPTVESGAVTMNVGQTVSRPVTHSSYTHDTTTTYTSSNTGVATYDGGVITAITPGSATVKGTCQTSSEDTETVTVTVNTPVPSQSNLSGLLVNSSTVLNTTTTNTPEYYEFDYSVDGGTNWTSENDNKSVSGTYIDIVGGKAIAKKPGTQTVTYRIKAGTAANNITYTGATKTFTAQVAEPTVTISNPPANILLEDTSNKGTVSGLANYDLTASDVTWSVVSQTQAVAPAEGETDSVLNVNSASGALTPLNAGTATLRATVKFNDDYTKNIDLSVTVTAATLTVNSGTSDVNVSAVYGTENLALDYTNASKATFTVATNAKESDFASKASVTIEKVNENAPFTVTPASLTSNSQEVTVQATGLTASPQKIYIRYWIGKTEIESLRRTVYVTIGEYEEYLTIYFRSDSGMGDLNTSAYAYSWVSGQTGSWLTPYGGTAGDGMVKIGTVGSDSVFAQTYKKTDVIGAHGASARRLLFNSDYNTFSNAKQTNDIVPDGDSFKNYQYFNGGSGTTSNNGKLDITQEYYGCLKPTKAELTIADRALPNSTDFSTTLTYTIEADGYTGTDGNALVGYYTINTAPSYVTLSPNRTSGKIETITATAKNSDYGTDNFGGYLYFQNDNVLETPETTSDAQKFIALPYTVKNLTVTNVKSTLHLRPVKISTTSYTAATATMSATGTYGGTANTDLSAHSYQNDLGTNVTIGTTTLDGYTLSGYYVTTDDPGETLPANTVPTSTDATYTFKTSEIKDTGGTITSDYYVYALYRRNIEISASKSYHWNGHSATYLTAPPKTIEIKRDGTVVATYTFDNSASATTALANKAATYGDGTIIPLAADSFNVLAGDVVTLSYNMLAASDKINAVYYSNTFDPTLDTAGYESNKVALAGTTINQKTHTVTFTVSEITEHITVDLGTKHRITFKDNEGFTTDIHIGGYYADGEDIEFTAERAGSATCTYSLGIPVFYDTDDKILVTALPSAEDMAAAGKTEADYHVDAGFNLTFNSETDKFIGVMPAYDVVIDMNVSTHYRMSFDTKVLSDVVGGKTDFRYGTGDFVLANASKLTVKNGETSIITAATTSAGPKNTEGTLVEKGAEIVYSVETQSGYTFLGWYSGTADGPDLDKGLINESTTFTLVPEKDTFVWAVATRDFFIAGNFTYDETTGALTHKANTADNNNSTKWKTANEYYRMEYDAVEDAYAITFNSIDKKNTSRTSGNPDLSTSTTNSAYATIYLFKCYATKGTGSAVGTETYWNNVSSYGNCHMDYPSDTKTNDHMYFGKWKDAGGSGMFEYTKRTTDDGYDVPVTLYFKPSASANNSKWYIKATRVWPDVYISDGYDKIDNYTNSTSTVVTIKSGDNYVALTSSNSTSSNFGTSVTEYEKQVKKYNFKQENAEIKLSKTVDEHHSVPGFLVYDLTEDRVYPQPATRVGETNEYTATMTIGKNKLYICPVIYYSDSDAITVTVDASQLVKDEWGDLLSCYPWYATGTSIKANGGFPGQLMYPSDDASKWTGKYKPNDGAGHNMTGITFANYAEGNTISNKTWLGRDVIGSDKVISIYNDVHRSTEAAYNKSNVAVQSYDYREPFAFFDNQVSGKTTDEAAVLSFAFKYGNNDVMKYYHDYLVNDYDSSVDPDKINIFSGIHHINSSNVTSSVASGKYKLTRESFEMMTDVTGNYYVDLNGTLLEDQPTPSFYVIAKGQVYYLDNNLVEVGRSGSNRDEPKTPVTYDGLSKMEYGVQWYVYDANGDYITNMLSAGFADEVDSEHDDHTTLIAKKLQELGYAVDGKGVGISYDYPRYYEDTNIYRFEGQWYATKKTTPVKVNAVVGVFTNGSYNISSSNSETYGTAEVWYDYDAGSSTYEKYVETDSARSYVKLAVGDTGNSPVYLNASEDNFIGWFYKDSLGNMVKASDKNELFYPTISGNATFYAIYEVKANYTFIYLDRNGNKTQYVKDIALNSAEIKGYAGNNNKPNVPTYIWNTDEIKTAYNTAMNVTDSNSNGSIDSGDEGWISENPYTTALADVNAHVSSYQYQGFTWPTASSTPAGTSITPNSSLMSLEITANCPKQVYTITIKKMDTSGNETLSSSASVESGKVLTFSGNYQFSDDADSYVKCNFNTSGIKYWSSDPAGNKPLTTVSNYGLVITHGGTIYGQTKPISGLADWIPTVESLSKTRKKTKSSDTTYLDFNSYFVNTTGDMIREMDTKPHYGILLAYDKVTGNYVNLDAETAQRYIKYFAEHPKVKSGTISYGGGTKNVVLTCYDYNDDAHVSNRNRANFVITGDHASLESKKLTVFTYVYYGSTASDISLSSTSFVSGNTLNQFTVSQFTEGSTAVFQ